MRDDSNSIGFNVIGYVSGNLGIGVTARNIVRALIHRGAPVAVYDLDPGQQRGRYDRRFAHLEVTSPDDLPYPVNLVVLPPAKLADLLRSRPGLAVLRSPDRLNVAFSMWELTVLPRPWKTALEYFDVVVAESEFIRSCFDRNLSGVIALTARHPLELPHVPLLARRRFGLPEDRVVFINSFDTLSDPERKNPYAAVEAFERAFRSGIGATLVLKVNNAFVGGRPHPVLTWLQERRRVNRNIILLTGLLDYAETLALYACCDVLVSLHRAEGLGLPLMEAMALGKPVIATAWSGNMDFTNSRNACLVGYELVPVKGTIPDYSRTVEGLDAVWADPSVEQAAAWMARLAGDAVLRATKGRAARDAMDRFRRLGEEASFVSKILDIYADRRLLPQGRTREDAWGRVRDALEQHELGTRPWIRRVEKRIRILRRRLRERAAGRSAG